MICSIFLARSHFNLYYLFSIFRSTLSFEHLLISIIFWASFDLHYLFSIFWSAISFQHLAYTILPHSQSYSSRNIVQPHLCHSMYNCTQLNRCFDALVFSNMLVKFIFFHIFHIFPTIMSSSAFYSTFDIPYLKKFSILKISISQLHWAKLSKQLIITPTMT